MKRKEKERRKEKKRNIGVWLKEGRKGRKKRGTEGGKRIGRGEERED